MTFFICLFLIAFDIENCKGCHSPQSLHQKGEEGSQKSVMERRGEGVKVIAFFDVKGMGFVLKWLGVEWVKRGRHSETDIKRCELCHEGHEIIKYPEDGKSCNGCHYWLGEVEEKGIGGSFSGSIRPENLILSGAHHSIFSKGFAGKRAGMKVQLINSGCTGCHNLREGRHGAITQCTDCHDFSSRGIHDSHMKNIKETAELNGMDPEKTCGFCHPKGDDLYKAGCYNCHLSGHNPEIYYWKTK